jgi:hypothetical protein
VLPAGEDIGSSKNSETITNAFPTWQLQPIFEITKRKYAGRGHRKNIQAP